ncbi:hypothetical protein BaRGS_00029411 [Batillaria attramentaria]|uniref:DNA-directed DNA polymerase family A palm domain-containing protein n=1 Tax=Batillaria attramentaria TaxID=370345 RepID=A0ABD0JWS6_9CAEN
MKRCLRPQQNPPRFSDSGTCDEFLIMQRLEEKYSTVGRTSSVHKLFVAEGCSVSSDSAKTHYPVSARQKLTSSNDVEVMPVKDSSTTRIQKMLKTFEGESEKRQKTQQVCSASGDTTRTTPTLITEQDNSVITDVSGLSTAERSKLGEQMKAYRHTGWLLLFEDNSTSSNGSLLKPGTQPVKGLLFHADERTYLFPLVCEREILKWIRSTLASILRTDKISKVALNSKNLMVALLRDFAVGNQREASRWQFEDPAVAGWLLRPDNPPQTIQDLCDMTGLDLFTAAAERSYIVDPACGGLDYFRFVISGSLDAQLHVELVVVMERLRGQLMEQRLWQLFHCVEMPLTPLLAVMELQAITINVQAFVNFSDILKKKLERLECKAHELAGHPFSINSTQQLRQLLYEELCLDQKLPAHSKVTLTATTHHKSTSEPMLRQLMETHPLPAVILEHRQAIPKAPTVISDFEDNYIVGAESKTVEIYAREPYVCNEGNVFLAADFQQFSTLKVEQMSSCNSPASVVYSIMYGVGKDRLAEYLKVSPSKAKDIMDSFLVTFPAIQGFTRRCIDYAKRHGYTESILGRRRWVPKINHHTPQVRAQAERQAVNFCVQGGYHSAMHNIIPYTPHCNDRLLNRETL